MDSLGGLPIALADTSWSLIENLSFLSFLLLFIKLVLHDSWMAKLRSVEVVLPLLM